MIFEATVSHISVDEEGYVKCIKERYVVDDKELFSEVEEMLLTKFSELNEVDIPSIKRSKVREIANKRATPREHIWLATLADTFIDENGVEKETKYGIYIFADGIDESLKRVLAYMEQGYDMHLVQLKETKIVDVLK